MGINGVSQYTNTYSYDSVKNDSAKNAKVNEKNTEELRNQSAAGKDKASEYYNYLQKKFDCVREGKVTLAGTYLKECANNPQKAKELEDNLAFFKQSYESGYQSAKANAQALGARLVSHTESWEIDSTGNITMIAATTVSSDTGTKGAKEMEEERQERLKEKREKEVQQEKRMEKRKEEKELLEEIRHSIGQENEIQNMSRKSIDITV